MNPTKVFISYSHESEIHSEKVLEFSDTLLKYGIDSFLDRYEMCPSEGWPRWIDNNILEADFVLLICTETYLKRLKGTEKGLGVAWEGALIYQYIYDSCSHNLKFIPILFEGCDISNIPAPLKSTTYYYYKSNEEFDELYCRLTNQPKIIKPSLGNSIIKAQKSNFFDRSSITWLNRAIATRDVLKVEQFIQLGIDLNLGDEVGYTPLEMAIAAGDLEMVKYLIKSGANVNHRKNEFSNTPISMAIVSKNSQIVLELVRKGADIHLKSPLTDSTPLDLAFAMESYDLIKEMKAVLTEI